MVRLAILAVILIFVSPVYALDPSKVNEPQKADWCKQQVQTCNSTCAAEGGEPKNNSCEKNSLNWSCTCSNGRSPDLSTVKQTIPYFICMHDLNEALNSVMGNEKAILRAREAHKCE